MLAWSDCVRATWMLSGRQLGPAAGALASAYRLLEQGARGTNERLRWSRILAPHHGLTVNLRRP
jgi:hypothetical protein